MENTASNASSENKILMQIAKNNCYELSYNPQINRIYFAILGFWKSESQVPDLLSDWDKVLLYALPGFTIITDMRTMITHPQSMNSLHEKAQLKVKAAGVAQVANVMPSDKIASLQIGSIVEKTLLPFRNFSSVQEAELWLNQAFPSA